MLDWNRLNWQGHWLPYEDYVNRSYGPKLVGRIRPLNTLSHLKNLDRY